MFDTWGPFTCRSHDPDEIDALWTEFRADETADLENGVGIYIISVENVDGTLTPWYVGQTYRSFGKRLFEHFKRSHFADLFQHGALKVFLIARATQKGQVRRARELGHDRRDRKNIDWLEVDLIDKCRLINPSLMNRQQVKFLDNLWVGGYRGRGALDPEALNEYPSRNAFARMLNLNSGRKKDVRFS